MTNIAIAGSGQAERKPKAAGHQSQLRLAARTFMKDRLATASIAIVLAIIVITVLAPWIAP